MTARFANNNPIIITHRYNFFRNIFCCNSRILALAVSVICLIDSKCCPVSSNFSRWNLISSAVRSPIASVSCAILALSSNNRVVSCGASLNPLVFLFFIVADCQSVYRPVCKCVSKLILVIHTVGMLFSFLL